MSFSELHNALRVFSLFGTARGILRALRVVQFGKTH